MAIVKGNNKDNNLRGPDDLFNPPYNEIYGYGGNDTIKGGFFAYNKIFGGDGDDVITSGANGDTLYGEAGNDYIWLATYNSGYLYGGEGSDTLIGGSGNNFFDGGEGADYMRGGDGADTYVVDNINDLVVETFVDYDGEINPRDKIIASISIVAPERIEDVTLTGNGHLNATGNAANNVIVGNNGKNTLLGLVGDDTLDGGAKNDVLDGGAGSDVLYGGSGNDTLTGGKGADNFVFDTKLNATKNVDLITDFSKASDIITLDASVFKQIDGLGALSKKQFVLGVEAQDADDRIIYDRATGSLFYDADGTGSQAAVKFAELGAGTALTWKQIVVDDLI